MGASARADKYQGSRIVLQRTAMQRFLHPGFRSSASRGKEKLPTWSGDLEALINLPAVEFGPPFDDNNADLVLRSSDSVDFPVHQAFLIKSSSFFKTILSLPQPFVSAPNGTARPSTHHRGSLPVIPVVEKGSVIHVLLSYLLPITPVLPDSLDDAMDFVNAAYKYEMEVVVVRARNILRRFLTVDTSLRIYAFAHRLELRDEMLAAARQSLRLPLPSDHPEHDDTRFPCGSALLDLWNYRKTYIKSLEERLDSCIVADPTLLPPGELGEWIDAKRCQSDQQCDNNATTWRTLLKTGATQIVADVTHDPGCMLTWRLPFESTLAPSSCQCSCDACSMLRSSSQKVERSLIEVLDRIVMDKIILQIDTATLFSVA
ncbi:uncharacterized protein STEHIDRAFT_155192 [Stereum hirsutum FP-91666 SS1]|uniref:uncharacterized protein n=1 Tax=Stereum hirsutum (strain FP-91666) TaxID=721885 RepID=UPI000440CD85|nr:uncharacterized protein STEHIDRAFT_155192 [Stereum hirsutum FP-91666 SS1]EIM87824.1 hypothetical protein STEHIDRAFT_155192 [Stereum hirsutum FP-91666 SS1]